MKNFSLSIIFSLFCWSANAYVIVGNGDDGADLEGTKPITDGPIVTARTQALALLEKLGVAGVRGLGTLYDEVRTSELFLAAEDRAASLTQDQGAFHADMRGKVYARTLPTAHAKTRFFPVAQTLNPDQLVALHIHEALHRSLPAEVRENEAVVSEITLAITGPGATRDQIEQAVNKNIPEVPNKVVVMPNVENDFKDQPGYSNFERPSQVGYTYRTFFNEPGAPSNLIRSMHSIHSHLYAFGNTRFPLGIGIEMAFINTTQAFLMGPLGISARLRLWSGRGFDVGVWGTANINTLSAEEMQNSSFGRDIGTIGVNLKKTFDNGYVENLISISTQGTSTQKLGLVVYDYEYGNVVQVKLRSGLRLSQFQFGGFAEMYLADYFKVRGGAFNYDSGRYRIIAVGPELGWLAKDFSILLQGRVLANATQGANFDYLGNLLGAGMAQGGITAMAGVNF